MKRRVKLGKLIPVTDSANAVKESDPNAAERKCVNQVRMRAANKIGPMNTFPKKHSGDSRRNRGENKNEKKRQKMKPMMTKFFPGPFITTFVQTP